MNSRIYTGTVTHVRLRPVRHQFVYPACYYGLDLAELPALGKLAPVFGYNAMALAMVRDSDYLGRSGGSIGEKFKAFLTARGLAAEVARVELMTVARCCLYAYNPVNFYLCYRIDGSLKCAAAEINNTYGETHLYLLDQPVRAGRDYQAAFRAKKEFFVSPFFDLRGDYVFRFARSEEKTRIQVELWREDRLALWARLCGQGAPLTRGSVLRAFVQSPMSAALTIPRIIWQALKLKRKGLKPLLKPTPAAPMTIRTSRRRSLNKRWSEIR
jgi:cyclopropane-fatty-acyl-phospholipid synthase